MADIQKGAYYATVNLQWNSPFNHSINSDRVPTINYIIAVYYSDLGSSTVWKTVTESRVSILRLPYNLNHTVSVTATNCAGSGTPIELSTLNIGESIEINRILIHGLLNAVNCSIPSANSGIAFEPYSDTTEGAMIYFHCDEEFSLPTHRERRVAVCGSDGKWSPQLQGENLHIHTLVEFMCLHTFDIEAMDCTLPLTTENLDKSEHAETIFQCERGSGKFFAICMQDTIADCTPLPITAANTRLSDSGTGIKF